MDTLATASVQGWGLTALHADVKQDNLPYHWWFEASMTILQRTPAPYNAGAFRHNGQSTLRNSPLSQLGTPKGFQYLSQHLSGRPTAAVPCSVPLNIEFLQPLMGDPRSDCILPWALWMWRRPYRTTCNASAAGRIASCLEHMRCGARMRLTCRFGKWATKKVGFAGGMSRAMWSGVAMLSRSIYLDGVLGRLSLLVLCASKSICFRAWS